MGKNDRRGITGRIAMIAGMTLLALSGTPSLRADLRDDIRREYGVTTLEEALPSIDQAKKGGSPSGWYFSGMIAMLDYDFPKAKKDFAEYKRLTKKGSGGEYNKSVDNALAGLKEAEQQFERFQDIVVIDAYEVDRDNFFKQLRLPLSAGRVTSTSEVPGDNADRGEAAFISEGGDYLIWSQVPESEADSVASPQPILMEANVLADGSMSAPRFIDLEVEDPDFPFMTADGATLYFSAEGENSVGGRDIFIASRDAATGEYRAPVNAGFPFNSAADDYLLAIDEENGVGWWATDRRMLPDNKITLYVFMLPEGRKNFEGDDDQKRLRGCLDDIRVTWEAAEVEDADDEDENVILDQEEIYARQEAREKAFRQKAEDIRKIKPGQKPRRKECMIPIAPGKYIYSADDVSTTLQKELVEKYIRADREYEVLKQDLDKKRREYAKSPSKAAGDAIKKMEEKEEAARQNLTQILSALYKEIKQSRR